MLTGNSYLFITGAGAGKPYGFPLGDELYNFIANRAIRSFPELFSDQNVREMAVGFSKELMKTCGVSIDRYLNLNKKLKDIGVLSIAAAIHSCEQNSIGRFPFDGISLEGDWYTYLYKKMIEGLESPAELLKISENKISFITFNYDRSLEHYLFSNLYGLLKNAGGRSEEIAAKLVEVPIIHVYGKIGYLPWENKGEPSVAYGSPITCGDVAVQSSKLINLIYDERKDNPELEVAKKLVTNAETVFFLGFGYDDMNLLILGLPGLLKDKHVFGIAFKTTQNERNQIESKLVPGKPSDIKIEDCDCLMLLRNHLR